MKFSLATITSLAILSVTNALPTALTARAVDSSPINTLSCSSAAGGSCCSPTNGLVVLTQQWIQGLGPENAFTLHGLWPDAGGQTGDWGCDPPRNYTNVESILQWNQTLYEDMVTYWSSFKEGPDSNDYFWTHEWGKHGTCVSTLDPQCYSNYQQYQDVYEYFSTALQLRQNYDLFTILNNASITPGGTYSFHKFQSAIQSAIGATPMITCSHGFDLMEVRLYFHVQNGNQYIPADSIGHSNCHGSINYPTK